MADAGRVASAAGAGLRLALLLNAVACQVANLGVDIHSISKGITLFSTSLKQARQSLESEHSVHTQECLDTANQISEQALAVFEEVEDMLDKVQKPDSQTNEAPQSVQQRFKTCFKKQRVTYLLAQLESLKFSLMVIVQVLQLGRLVEVKNVLNTLTEELIAQERADAQNMLIVRYWSTKKLDRLWELARQEAKEDRKPTVQFEPSTSSTPDLTSPPSPTISKLPIIPLGVESSLNAVEESPKDMLRLTGVILDALLKRWIREEIGQRLVAYDSANAAAAAGSASPRAYVSSGSEDDYSDDGYDRPDMPGYYLEGTTTDWRKPHSQDARTQAAQLRKLYSTKQAHVHSDSEDSESSTSSLRRKTKRWPARDEKFVGRSSGDAEYKEPAASRPYSYSSSNKVPGSDTESNWRHEDAVKPQPSQTRPIAVPQPNAHKPTAAAATNNLHPARAPTSSPSNARHGVHQHQHQPHYSTTPNGFLSTTPNGSQSYQPRYVPARGFSRSMSDTIQQPQYLTPQQAQPQPPRHRNSRSRKGHHSGHHSPQPYDRHRDLKRTAMRGILGASAIGGFMDALEAFSII